MTRYGTIVPEGTCDQIYKECDALRAVQKNLTHFFKSRGFNEVITPSLEFYDVFDGKSNAMPQEMMYKLIDHKGRILVLRPDNTMPAMRVASTKLKSFQPPLRLFYNQNVFRVSPTLSGRRDEIPQCGIELLGINGIKADIEVIVTAIESLKLVTKDFRFEIGHVGFYKAIIDSLNCGDNINEKIRKFIEAKNYAALNDIISETSVNDKAAKALLELPRMFGGEEVFETALKAAPNKTAEDTICYLRSIYEILCKMGYKDNVMIDLGLIQQIDYYTGVAFRGYIEGSGEAVLSGGRYDGLSESFGADMAATGFAVNTEAVANYACKKEKTNRPEKIVFYSIENAKSAFEYVTNLNSKGIVCEISNFDSFEETINYAKAKGINEAINFMSEDDLKVVSTAKEGN